MKILITGANGMLAKAMVEKFKENNELILTDVTGTGATLDITNFKEVKDFVAKTKPEMIINCAAYTNVDKAEEEKSLAKKINTIGPKNLAIVAKKNDCLLVHFSTDYVFGGDLPVEELYREDDKKTPVTVYGNTKLAGEKEIQAHTDKYYIFRTAWLYGEGKNFVKTMIKLGRENSQVKVVADQHGSPTYTKDLVDVVEQVLNQKLDYGVYHATDLGYTTWAKFAKRIFEMTEINCKVIPVTSEEYGSAANRPKNSMISKERLISLGIYIPSWEEGLENYLREIGEKAIDLF